jgi:hypothetical protein
MCALGPELIGAPYFTSGDQIARLPRPNDKSCHPFICLALPLSVKINLRVLKLPHSPPRAARVSTSSRRYAVGTRALNQPIAGRHVSRPATGFDAGLARTRAN